jgi:hypothetical protein
LGIASVLVMLLNLTILGAAFLRRSWRSPLNFFYALILGFSLVSLVGLVLAVSGKFLLFPWFFYGLSAVGWISTGVGARINMADAKRLIRNPKFLQMILAIVVAIILGAVLRGAPTQYILWDTDPADYLLSGLELANLGKLNIGFYPLLPIWIAIYSQIFGWKQAVYFNIQTGVMLIPAFFYLAYYFWQKSLRHAYLMIFLVTISTLSLWTSRFPYSENLMIFTNVCMLATLFKVLQTRRLTLRDGLIFLCLAFLSSFTRVTAVLWLVELSAYLIYHLSAFPEDRDRNKSMAKLYGIFCLSYGAAIIYSFKVNSAKFFHYVTDYAGPGSEPMVPYVLAGAFLLPLIVAYFITLLGRKNWLHTSLTFLTRNSWFTTIVTVVLVVGLLFMAAVGVNDDFFAGARYLQYQWINHFTPVFYILFPLGWYGIVASKSITSRVYSFFWFFTWCSYAMIILASIPFGRLDHFLYLYWDRYFYPEAFVIGVLISTSALMFLFSHRNKYLQYLAIGCLLVYTGGSAWGVYLNRSVHIHGEASEVLGSISEIVKQGKPVIIDFDPKSTDFCEGQPGLCYQRALQKIVAADVPIKSVNSDDINGLKLTSDVLHVAIISSSSEYVDQHLSALKTVGIKEIQILERREFTVETRPHLWKSIYQASVQTDRYVFALAKIVF